MKIINWTKQDWLKSDLRSFFTEATKKEVVFFFSENEEDDVFELLKNELDTTKYSYMFPNVENPTYVLLYPADYEPGFLAICCTTFN